MRQLIVNDKLLIGRNEWCCLPDLNVPAIKAKIDTGAKTSSIHAFNIHSYRKRNSQFVSFEIHPIQANNHIITQAHAKVIDKRFVMSSNGHKEHRYIIATTLVIDSFEWDIELSLSNRDPLRYRMILGREALNHRVLVDPGLTCNQEKVTKSQLRKLYGVTKLSI